MLHYERLGHGPHTLLAFHGVGQTGRSCYLTFANYLGDYYTIYAFDLFYHGQSAAQDLTSPEPDVITKDDWKHYLQDFLTSQHIERFDVAGFSIGGRFALATAEAFCEHINRLLLIAPDGVVEHPLYRLATRSAPMRWLYRKILIQHPQLLITLADFTQKTRLVPAGTIRFVRRLLDSPKNRQIIYHAWVGFRKLTFSISTLYALLQARSVEVWLFTGKHDTLLPPTKLVPLSDKLPDGNHVLLDTGHTRLVEQTAVYLLNTLK